VDGSFHNEISLRKRSSLEQSFCRAGAPALTWSQILALCRFRDTGSMRTVIVGADQREFNQASLEFRPGRRWDDYGATL
jgi:hypothetical protein